MENDAPLLNADEKAHFREYSHGGHGGVMESPDAAADRACEEALNTWLQNTGGHLRNATVRDYFAGKALQGMLATRSAAHPTFTPEADAKYVYQIADAMIIERNKPQQPKE